MLVVPSALPCGWRYSVPAFICVVLLSSSFGVAVSSLLLRLSGGAIRVLQMDHVTELSFIIQETEVGFSLDDGKHHRLKEAERKQHHPKKEAECSTTLRRWEGQQHHPKRGGRESTTTLFGVVVFSPTKRRRSRVDQIISFNPICLPS